MQTPEEIPEFFAIPDILNRVFSFAYTAKELYSYRRINKRFKSIIDPIIEKKQLYFDFLPIADSQDREKSIEFTANKLLSLRRSLPQEAQDEVFKALWKNLKAIASLPTHMEIKKRLYLIAASQGNPDAYFSPLKTFLLGVKENQLEMVEMFWQDSKSLISNGERVQILEWFAKGKCPDLERFLKENKGFFEEGVTKNLEQQDWQLAELARYHLLAKAADFSILQSLLDILSMPHEPFCSDWVLFREKNTFVEERKERFIEACDLEKELILLLSIFPNSQGVSEHVKSNIAFFLMQKENLNFSSKITLLELVVKLKNPSIFEQTLKVFNEDLIGMDRLFLFRGMLSFEEKEVVQNLWKQFYEGSSKTVAVQKRIVALFASNRENLKLEQRFLSQEKIRQGSELILNDFLRDISHFSICENLARYPSINAYKGTMVDLLKYFFEDGNTVAANIILSKLTPIEQLDPHFKQTEINCRHNLLLPAIEQGNLLAVKMLKEAIKQSTEFLLNSLLLEKAVKSGDVQIFGEVLLEVNTDRITMSRMENETTWENFPTIDLIFSKYWEKVPKAWQKTIRATTQLIKSPKKEIIPEQKSNLSDLQAVSRSSKSAPFICKIS